MTVYELTYLLTDFSKIGKDFLETGKFNNEFKLFLNANFGYYSDNILVGAHFGSNILYQYDSERDCIKSSFDEFNPTDEQKMRMLKNIESKAYANNVFDFKRIYIPMACAAAAAK